MKIKSSDDSLEMIVNNHTAANKVPSNVTVMFEKITELCITFEQNILADNDIQTLCYVFQNLKHLTSLKVNFNHKELSDEQLLRLLPLIFWNTSQISKLEIDLSYCQVGDQSIVFLAEKIIARVPTLKNITVNLNFTMVSDKSAEAFDAILVSLSQDLEQSKIDIYGTQVKISQSTVDLEDLLTITV